jgi:hypothetical protein
MPARLSQIRRSDQSGYDRAQCSLRRVQSADCGISQMTNFNAKGGKWKFATRETREPVKVNNNGHFG